ncbi:hypothetical protein AYK24_07350 [Thermoplasmatales archaeon SG8-52-4]|nr:MAG: hypothetical protein AYK24_07350 [Thermoplasmatales archaeon SG8-52-4]
MTFVRNLCFLWGIPFIHTFGCVELIFSIIFKKLCSFRGILRAKFRTVIWRKEYFSRVGAENLEMAFFAHSRLVWKDKKLIGANNNGSF